MDLPYTFLEERGISVLYYSYVVDGVTYEDDLGRDPQSIPRFYEWICQGKQAATSQISVGRYIDYFAGLAQKGDVLHLAFSSGMSGSANNAILAAAEVQERYPERKIMAVDTLCGSGGYGLLTEKLSELRDAGATLEEAYDWVICNRGRMHHQFFSSDMTHLHRTGRVSGPAAMVATVLNICPLMCLDNEGRIKAYGKARGKKAAIKALVDAMEIHAEKGLQYDGPCCIAHSMCKEDGQALVQAIQERFPLLKGKIPLYDIGTTIGAHTGVGTVSLYFWGDQRTAID